MFGRGRWTMEALRPYVRQYFVESDTDGAPINRMFRNVVCQRAKNADETEHLRCPGGYLPYRLRMDRAFPVGYKRCRGEGPARCRLGPRLSAALFGEGFEHLGHELRRTESQCHPGIEPGCQDRCLCVQHRGRRDQSLSPGARRDLIWQIGTGYLGCRDERGRFSAEDFREKAALPAVKMIEIKLSRGVEPGHDRYSASPENTPEIA